MDALRYYLTEFLNLEPLRITSSSSYHLFQEHCHRGVEDFVDTTTSECVRRTSVRSQQSAVCTPTVPGTGMDRSRCYDMDT